MGGKHYFIGCIYTIAILIYGGITFLTVMIADGNLTAFQYYTALKIILADIIIGIILVFIWASVKNVTSINKEDKQEDDSTLEYEIKGEIKVKRKTKFTYILQVLLVFIVFVLIMITPVLSRISESQSR